LTIAQDSEIIRLEDIVAIRDLRIAQLEKDLCRLTELADKVEV